VPLPPKSVETLNSSPSDNEKYFFRNGNCLPTSAVKIWERTFETVVEKAHVPGGTIHRFRDTFAVERLLKGIPIEQCQCCSGTRR
jgi:integrase/recombinase XerD